MNILFVSWPSRGHFFPMIPLAAELASAGHQVKFATSPGFDILISDFGFDATACGPSLQETFLQATERFPDLTSPADNWRRTAKVLSCIACPPMVHDLVEKLRSWRPDLIVHDSAALSGPLAATILGIHYVHHAAGRVSDAYAKFLGKEMVEVWRSFGLEAPALGGMYEYLYLNNFPPSLRRTDNAGRRVAKPLRPILADCRKGLKSPDWIYELPNQATVYVTLGTTFNDNADFFKSIISALAPEALNLVVTLGPNGDRGPLGDLPDNVYVEGYLPNSQILPFCNLVVCHGGSGTVLGALSHGLPLLIVPQGYDNPLNAEACVQAGVARVVYPSKFVPDRIRTEVRALLDNPGYKRAATRLKAEIEGMSPPRELLNSLLELARSRPQLARLDT